MNALTAALARADASPPTLGASAIVRLFYRSEDPTPIWEALKARALADPQDYAALLDMSLMLQSTGPQGLEVQRAALELQPVYRRIHGVGAGLRIFALMVAGDMAANTPLDFLLEGSDDALYTVYVDARTPALPDFGAFDVGFMAVGESPDNAPVLANIEKLLRGWQGPPILNARPARIAELTRDRLHRELADEPSILTPAMRRTLRGDLEKVGMGADPIEIFGHGFPLIARPIGGHGGEGMARLDAAADAADYLLTQGDDVFYVSQFVDYADRDGLYAKQRVAFVDGQAFACHCCVSTDWMVHYVKAKMGDNPRGRAIERAWMETFHADFAIRHARAFEALNRCFELDYFVIDCAEAPDGRLLLFEADVIMLVHDMDPEDVFPYKRAPMARLMDAFRALLARRAPAAARPAA
ncbi:MAG: tetratricopeptide repeat-containing protein [Hyphomicrobiales bacterium]|nr:tetratricopeptide repeat-containing protein [Hyphomicrobiales bacterium]